MCDQVIGCITVLVLLSNIFPWISMTRGVRNISSAVYDENATTRALQCPGEGSGSPGAQEWDEDLTCKSQIWHSMEHSEGVG